MNKTNIIDCNFCFKTLNYLGSKLRLLDFIEEHVRHVTPANAGVCDLFAGSGCVSYKLSANFPVIACDIQRYSMVICSALLTSPDLSDESIERFIAQLKISVVKLDEAFSSLIQIEDDAIKNKDIDTLAEIIEYGSLEVFRQEKTISAIFNAQSKVTAQLSNNGLIGRDSFISRHYGGVFFSYRQAVQIDTILSLIRRHANNSSKDIFLAALLSTASDIVGTVGKHFAQPIKTRDAKGNLKSMVYNKAIRDKTSDVFELYEKWLRRYISLPRGKFECHTMQGDYMDCLAKLGDDVRTIYADPPYTRDHYSRFYHVLETIAIGDEPEISKVKIHGGVHISKGLYRNDRHQSPFCIKSKAPVAFKKMFKVASVARKNLILSYSPYDETNNSHPRVVTMNQLITWAKEYFTKVELVSAGFFSHNKLNSKEHFLEASNEAEMLIICTGGQE